ncbi:MAG: four helix bundle protein [Armatimonadetes bacterium]|nr:four helix bundle protein [Armatimonadota bacterium]
MPLVKDFKELRCYQDAFAVAMRVFELSRDWPKSEERSLTSQSRRATRSIAANIAEAWGKRRYEAHFVAKLSDADAECHESRSWIDFAMACGYITPAEFDLLESELKKISGSLVKMMSSPSSWCGPATKRN